MAVLEYGLWEQIRVDHGTEFYLILFIHEQLRSGRGDPGIAPYRQTSCRDNHIIEWVELNHHVTYPLKRAITEKDNLGQINMQSVAVKFCVSMVVQAIAEVGMNHMIIPWNAHLIPQHGIPNVFQGKRDGTIQMHSSEVPTVEDAVKLFRQQGGSLTDLHPLEVTLLGCTHNFWNRDIRIFNIIRYI